MSGLAASFIVPTHQRAEVLDISIPLFLLQDCDAAFEVIVISDGPDADTDAVMSCHEGPSVRYEALPENRGPGAARNRALEMARGEIIVFVDDDSLIKPDYLSLHLAHHAADPKAVVTGPIIDVAAPPDMTDPPAVKRHHRHLNPFPGGNSSIARAHLDAVGGFDEAFRVYGWEDPELWARLSVLGLKPRFEPRAPIYHFKPQGRETTFAYKVRRERMRGANGGLFYRKHPGFGVGLQTKQLGLFRALAGGLGAVLGLPDKARRAEAGEYEPKSGLMRALVLLHTEITAGRRD
ncbi:glycosyltransferase family 2 protein [Anianabacter salinae]|uniref:glycosyltransferase family 2 protein n=1 Tax=Anianabacter salinae TaxID=2851023 RepID=UPI00225DECDF|nr:glycosyltransferase family 2 protein [Anianabacter salinae]MBV0912357.1 glycosyltransferase [Anianabacter salinae]